MRLLLLLLEDVPPKPPPPVPPVFDELLHAVDEIDDDVLEVVVADRSCPLALPSSWIALAATLSFTKCAVPENPASDPDISAKRGNLMSALRNRVSILRNIGASDGVTRQRCGSFVGEVKLNSYD